MSMPKKPKKLKKPELSDKLCHAINKRPPGPDETVSPYLCVTTRGDVRLSPDGVASVAQYREAFVAWEKQVQGTEAKTLWSFRTTKWHFQDGNCTKCAHYAGGLDKKSKCTLGGFVIPQGAYTCSKFTTESSK